LSRIRDFAIDPALQPLPEEDDEDFPSVETLLAQKGKPTAKIAGACRPSSKARGKQRAIDEVPSSKSAKRKATAAHSKEPELKKSHGCTAGTPNYSFNDVDALMDILEVLQPLGAKAWNSASGEFNLWAEENGHPTRSAKSLENKFKQVCLPFICNVISL
jgi:hypothetical protein